MGEEMESNDIGIIANTFVIQTLEFDRDNLQLLKDKLEEVIEALANVGETPEDDLYTKLIVDMLLYYERRYNEIQTKITTQKERT
ncbi:hypothetical protein [Clostridium perfringens]|uniref:hypothetical protein n=1 Tax=Clostridium perfringens TaxID=1502 RepID=UPI0018E43DB9|nr:hypothetical protein [Clostridium perfringens]MBI6042186.1 hypothetical protein [Clostridium perfringens]